MATIKWATVTGHQDLGGQTHRVLCEADEALGHVAGNYVILRSALPHPDKPGEVLRKAYSISSAPDPAQPRRFHMTVAVVGPLSAWIAARRPGERLSFSGPWGKRFRAQPDDAPGPVHLFATGTGWSPIGAMACARQRAGGGPVSVWWQTEHTYDPDVLQSLTADARFTVRTGAALSAAVPADPEALYFLAGDGAVITPLCARLRAAGVPAERLRTEPFFNRPPRAA